MNQVSILPPNATPLESAVEAVAARIGDIPVPIATLWDPNTIPATHLPYLAWALSVSDEWGAAMTDEQRRTLVKNAVAMHRMKGTPGGVRAALAALGIKIEIVEWFQAGSNLLPFEFSVRALISAPVTPREIIGPEPATTVRAAINHYKNARSHLAQLVFTVPVLIDHPAPQIGARTGARQTATMLVPIGTHLDINAAEAVDMDDLAVTQTVSVSTALPVTFGRAPQFDDVLAGDGFDQVISHGETEPVPPLGARAHTALQLRINSPAMAAARTTHARTTAAIPVTRPAPNPQTVSTLSIAIDVAPTAPGVERAFDDFRSRVGFDQIARARTTGQIGATDAAYTAHVDIGINPSLPTVDGSARVEVAATIPLIITAVVTVATRTAVPVVVPPVAQDTGGFDRFLTEHGDFMPLDSVGTMQ